MLLIRRAVISFRVTTVGKKLFFLFLHLIESIHAQIKKSDFLHSSVEQFR